MVINLMFFTSCSGMLNGSEKADNELATNFLSRYYNVSDTALLDFQKYMDQLSFETAKGENNRSVYEVLMRDYSETLQSKYLDVMDLEETNRLLSNNLLDAPLLFAYEKNYTLQIKELNLSKKTESAEVISFSYTVNLNCIGQDGKVAESYITIGQIDINKSAQGRLIKRAKLESPWKSTN